MDAVTIGVGRLDARGADGHDVRMRSTEVQRGRADKE